MAAPAHPELDSPPASPQPSSAIIPTIAETIMCPITVTDASPSSGPCGSKCSSRFRRRKNSTFQRTPGASSSNTATTTNPGIHTGPGSNIPSFSARASGGANNNA